MLLALIISPLTTHPFRNGAPFLILIETPPTYERSLRSFHVLHRNCLRVLSASCFAACGHHLSPRIAVVFPLLSSLQNSSTYVRLTSSPPPLTHPVTPYIFHMLLLFESVVPHGHMSRWGGGGAVRGKPLLKYTETCPGGNVPSIRPLHLTPAVPIFPIPAFFPTV